jgi:hypothetical protein
VSFVGAAIIAALNFIPNIPTIGIPNSLCSRALGGGYLMLAGMYLYKYKHLFLKLKWALISLIVSVLLFYLHLPFSSLFGGIAIFIFAMLLPLKENALTNTMRKQSMWIYYLHMYFMFACFGIFSHLGEPLHVAKAFAIASIATFLTTRMIVGLTNRGYCTWLNKLVK